MILRLEKNRLVKNPSSLINSRKMKFIVLGLHQIAEGPVTHHYRSQHNTWKAALADAIHTAHVAHQELFYMNHDRMSHPAPFYQGRGLYMVDNGEQPKAVITDPGAHCLKLNVRYKGSVIMAFEAPQLQFDQLRICDLETYGDHLGYFPQEPMVLCWHGQEEVVIPGDFVFMDTEGATLHVMTLNNDFFTPKTQPR